MGFLDKLKAGLSKTKNAIFGQIDEVLKAFVKVDEDLLEELEELLIMSDVGVGATEEIMERLRDDVKSGRLKEKDQVIDALKEILTDMIGEGGELNLSTTPSIILVIGVNGAGKTTLFRMIIGSEQADKGTFAGGETVKIGYVDQQHANIDPNKTVFETISDGTEFIRVGGKEINARAYLSRFNFTGSDQEKKCGVLSGGERNRLHLALTLKSEANVLLLDEPTNDIDVNTLRALEEGLENFAGCAVVISHDRWFLDRICTHILAYEGDGKVFWFEGSYSDYEANKRMRLGEDAEPHRVKYRGLNG